MADLISHFALGALIFIHFHGSGRPREPEVLRSVDLVLTTYATLAADHADQGILHQMEWYRVVLDEGIEYTASCL